MILDFEHMEKKTLTDFKGERMPPRTRMTINSAPRERSTI